MVPWYNFIQQPEGAEPEVYIGPHECHIEARGYGPSAIDRAMIHTPMLLLDHERRFAVSQLGIKNSNFESDHCGNVSRAIEYSLRHFELNESHTKVNISDSDDFDLIGLACIPTTPYYSPDLPRLQDHLTFFKGAGPSPVEQSSTLSLQVPADSVIKDIPPPSPITIDDIDDDEEAQSDMVELALQMFKESRKSSEIRPRQYVAKRLRKQQPKAAKP